MDPALLTILVVSALLKLGLAFWADGLTLHGDERVYRVIARGIAEGRMPAGFRPPGYPFFLATSASGDGSLLVARCAQALLSTLSVLWVYLLAAPFGRRTARWSAGLTACDPVLIGFSHLLWSETLYICLLLAGLLALASDADLRRRRTGPLTGVCWGLAAYVRPQILTYLPLVLVWLGWRARRRGALRARVPRVALLLGSLLLLLAPWTLYVWLARGELSVVSSSGPYNLLAGTHPTALFVDKDDHWSPHWGHLPEGGYEPGPALRVFWLRVATRPAEFLRKSAWEAAHLYTLDSFVLRHLRNRWYGELPPWVLPLAVLASVGVSAPLLAGGLLGLLAQPRSPFRSLAGLALLHATLLFGLSYSLSRYAAPARPLLAIGLAWLALHAPAARARLASQPGLAAWALAAGLLLTYAWWSDLPLLWDMLAHGGRAHRFSWID